MTAWSCGDDIIVGLSYLQYGVHVTPELAARLPERDEGSIKMRLENFQFRATNGERGLAHYAESTKDAHAALLPALLFHCAVNAMIDSGYTPRDMAATFMLPEAQARFFSEYISQRLKITAHL